MIRYTFMGRVLPEWDGFEIPVTFPTCTVVIPDAELEADIAFTIRKGRIAAVVSSKTDIDALSVRNYLESVLARAVDSYTYLTGETHTVEIEELLGPDGQFTLLDRGLPVQNGEQPLALAEVLEVLFQKPTMSHYAGQALADLRQAIRCPHDTGFFCYRGLENIREAFAVTPGMGKDRNDSFIQMREALGIDRSYLGPMQDFRNSQSHGEPRFTSAEERLELTRRLWRVLHRFYVYLLRGEIALLKEEFGVLK